MCNWYKNTQLFSVFHLMKVLEVGSGGAWALFWVVSLFWALFWALKRVKPLKNVLSRVNMLFWALKKGLKRADLLKRVLNWEVLLKRGLNWVGHSKKRSREERSYSKEGSGLNWVGHSKKCQREESRKKQEAVLRQETKDVSISKHGWQGEQDYYRWTLANLKHWIFIKVQGSSKSNFIPNKRLVTLLNQYQKIQQKGFWTQSTLYSTNGAQMTFQNRLNVGCVRASDGRTAGRSEAAWHNLETTWEEYNEDYKVKWWRKFS